MIEHINSLECTNETFKIDKPIRLIELFAGIGSQAKALERLNADFEHYKICELDKYAVTAYNAVHGTDFEPGDITKIHGRDLDIKDTNKYCYVVTYSFPCQDLSLAGKMKGMKKGDGTRSGLLWEVERLLEELLEEKRELPQVLLMENVPQVISKKNINDFNKWLDFLASIGYTSTYKVLNAKDYGIPQNRRRCFMVSILGNENYVFPKGQVLKLKLKDLCDEIVDEKYFLSEEQIKSIEFSSFNQNKQRIQDKDICDTLLARDFLGPKCIKVAELHGGKWDKIHENCRRVYSVEGLAPTITTMGGGNREPKILRIKENTLKGYKEAKDGDGVYINRVNTKRGTVQKDMIQTLKANPSDVGVVVKSNYPTIIQNPSMIAHPNILGLYEYSKSDNFNHYKERFKEGGDLSNTILASGNQAGIVVTKTICLNSKGGRNGVEGLQPSLQCRVYSDEGVSPAITTSYMPSYLTRLRIRKLTPLECWRLMGFDDEDFYKAKKALNQTYYKGRDKSNSRLYKMAGNSIVVNVLEAIFKKML